MQRMIFSNLHSRRDNILLEWTFPTSIATLDLSVLFTKILRTGEQYDIFLNFFLGNRFKDRF